MAFPRRPSAVLRYALPALLITLSFYLLSGPGYFTSQVGPLPRPWGRKYGPDYHPIDDLIRAADDEFAEKLSRTSQSLSDAAARYRERRGRHPPPGFDKWYEFAREKNAVIVEDFWDQIYHDLEPFWALSPARIRKEAWDFEMRIKIRDGKASSESDWFWTVIWLNLIGTIEHLLPDMDLALNAMDEPRLVVPWEEIDEYMKQAAKTRTMADARSVVSEFQKLPAPGEGPEKDEETPDKEWEDEKHYWLIARRGCAPSSAARKADVITDFDTAPLIRSSFALEHMRDGYVANYTLSTDVCHQPDLQGLEGIFVRPLSTSATRALFPMFGGSKLAVNNEILLPAPMYWNEEERFMGASGADIAWSQKLNASIWRGVATGGRNTEQNWRAFQRHRFVAMNNATQLARAEAGDEAPLNFGLPPQQYRLASQREGKLAEWVSSWADVAFTDLMCGYKDLFGTGCNYTNPYYTVVLGMPMAEQFTRKYLPDIDGNSFSGRYLGFLRSTSLPVKATLWREWHDSRLVAWKHFVPMDNRFGDWYGIMEYFLGDGARGVKGHDQAAERIAMDGKMWADKVLRKEDMQIYVLRLLLEYARLSDERRETMGWVEDLLEEDRWV
ncbi:KDEL motif-containing protein 1 [Madurella mycetomatis]|uniref:KDEL motif-containing protein 1 n=1 Tax=Madurella mycetomatis TaxID=100816 RepID=A0A175VSA8_9PEZI|nr:KDEL motif-containing protein 1 [Madurella mycetomatis]